MSWFKESKHTHRSSFANITDVVPSLQCTSWFTESKHTHRSSFANITNAVPSLQCISWFTESKHTHKSSFANITDVVPSLQCMSWFTESKHTHINSLANITIVVPFFFQNVILFLLYDAGGGDSGFGQRDGDGEMPSYQRSFFDTRGEKRKLEEVG